MLLYDVNCFGAGIFLYIIITMMCAGCAYCVNTRRTTDDPQKRNCHPLAVLLAPVTLPLFVLFWISRITVKVFFFGACLIVFPVAMIVVREAVLLRWLRKIATYIGNKILDTNTALATPLLKSKADQPESI